VLSDIALISPAFHLFIWVMPARAGRSSARAKGVWYNNYCPTEKANPNKSKSEP
jgi:hypothetical protein